MYEQLQAHRPNGPYSTFTQYVTKQKGMREPEPGHGMRRYQYVLYKEGRSRATRLIASDEPSAEWRIGSRLRLYSNGDWKDLGEYMVVGVYDSQERESTGDIPSHKLAYATFG